MSDMLASLDPLDERYTYSNPTFVKVLDPFDNLTTYSFHYSQYDMQNFDDCNQYGCKTEWDDGLLRLVNTYAGPNVDGGRLVRQENYTYTYDDESLLLNLDCPSIYTANSVYYNVRRAEVETIIPGGCADTTGRTRTVYGDWTNGEIRLAQEVKEYHDLELYRTTYTDYPHDVSYRYRSQYNSREIRDASGQVLSRTDTSFNGNRIQCSVLHVDPTTTGLDGCADGSLPPAPGDIAKVNSYDAETGNLVWKTIKGGDDGTTYVQLYTYSYGVLESAEYDDPAIEWHAVNRDVDRVGDGAGQQRSCRGRVEL